MAFITVNCPACGGQAQIEIGKSAMCPYCAHELNVTADAGFAFAPQEAQAASELQFAQPEAQLGQDIRFAAPPQPMPMQQAMPMPQEQYGMAAPQYDPATLEIARNKRKNWHVMNSALIGFQTLMFALGILLTVCETRFGVPLIMLWVLSTFGFGAISGITRPDAAYIEKKPFWKTRFLQAVTQFWMGAAISAAVGAILFVIIAGLFGML